MPTQVAQRMLVLAALALIALLVVLAGAHHGSRNDDVSLPAAAPAPGGGWFRALAAPAPLPTKPRRTACGHRLDAKTVGVAHPVLPCNAKVYIEYGDKKVLTAVIDRGPYIAGREFDLTKALADEIGLHGTQPIKWRFATAER